MVDKLELYWATGVLTGIGVHAAMRTFYAPLPVEQLAGALTFSIGLVLSVVLHRQLKP